MASGVRTSARRRFGAAETRVERLRRSYVEHTQPRSIPHESNARRRFGAAETRVERLRRSYVEHTQPRSIPHESNARRRFGAAETRVERLRRSYVELRGVEPLASSMRPRRSSQLSYSPEGRTQDNALHAEPTDISRAVPRRAARYRTGASPPRKRPPTRTRRRAGSENRRPNTELVRPSGGSVSRDAPEHEGADVEGSLKRRWRRVRLSLRCRAGTRCGSAVPAGDATVLARLPS